MKTVPIDNDWRYKYRLETDDDQTGADEPAAGLTGLLAWFSSVPAGPPIHAALVQTCTEYPGTPGLYSAVVDGNALRTHLAFYVGKVVHEVFGDGQNVFTSVARRVRGVREL